VYIDHSVVEACANEAVWLTRRVYPKKDERTIIVEKGGESIKRIEIWALKSI
jgi:hypothetical protein